MKKKKQLSERLPASTFIILSGLISALTISAGISASKLIFDFTSFNVSRYFFIFVTKIPTMFIIIGQSFLLKYQFDWSVIKWLIAGFVGIILMIVWHFVYSFLLAYIPYSVIWYWFLGIVPALIMALAQFVVLRNYVSKAWLWIITMICLNSIPLPLATIAYEFLPSMAIAGIQGLVTAMVLTWLVRMTIKDERKETNTENTISNQSSL